ncbi:heavy metal translocating P-type ATPase [Oculatella sp. LEGE 06141]|uniref:heavy metal translocating P-type ATPase n=1 Tax=Oculatella sp. LEGE 06141 TaxID=1828648 RepID=UPI001882CDB5|nr:heavy metal translocating P-type ATPase [Oculatella sp. LEGE 06141]MBE9180129.1 heavy metal translocating P-type ATPase [Oculatella sp. LEGE 06141]
MSLSLPKSLLTSHPIRFLSANPELLAAIACAILVFLGWLALNLNWLGLGIAILVAAYVVGGYESAREGISTLVIERELDVDLLMIVAALGAAALGLWQQDYYLMVDGAVLILIFAISGALEGVAMRRTERSIRGLMSLAADTARVIREGHEQIVSVEQLQVGDRLLVKPGELIPTDSRVLEGESAINEAPITGESLPVEKSPGSEVYAGTLNGSGALVVEVHQAPESSLIQRVIRLVQQAQTEAPPSQQFIERFERGYARVIVVTGLVLSILPPFLWQWDWETTIYRALIFLVVASPCALMASIMPTLLSGIATGARQGILFKTGAQLEAIGQVRAIAFDKTGTLTTGNLQVTDVIAAEGQSNTTVLRIAAALETYSEHPIGAAIVLQAQQQGVQWTEVNAVQAEAGQGIRGLMNHQPVWVGKADGITDCHLPPELVRQSQRLEASSCTVVWVVQDHTVLGLIGVADSLRPGAQQLIQNLRQLGVESIVMLTGDNQRTADTIAQAIGIDQVYANLLPEDKIHILKQLQQRYRSVAMVGDGINDAPALAQASVGITMGITGTDIALETADVVLMADRLDKLEQAIRLGRRSQRIVKQNIGFAIAFIALLMAANFSGQISLPIGVLGHEGSTLIVTLSGLRLLQA